MDRKELQRIVDEACDQAATQAAALIIHKLPEAIKKALKEIFKEYRRELIDYLFRERWVRIVVGLLTILGLIGLWIKEYT